MVEWMTYLELEQRLSAGYPPIGLTLRRFLQGRLSVEQASSGLRRGVAEQVELVAGLGPSDVWCGVVDQVPFAVEMTQPGADARLGYVGVQLWLPVRLRGGDRIDPSLLRVASAIDPTLGDCSHLQVAHLPFSGPGWGVVPAGDDVSIFSSRVRDDAVEVAALVSAEESSYTVVPIDASPRQWVVVGPRTGAFVSRVDVFGSEEEAERAADRWADACGERFSVHAGAIPPEAQ